MRLEVKHLMVFGQKNIEYHTFHFQLLDEPPTKPKTIENGMRRVIIQFKIAI